MVNFKIVMVAVVTATQLEYLRKLTLDNGVEAEFFTQEAEAESEEVEEEEITPTSTPLTGEMMDKAAHILGRDLPYIMNWGRMKMICLENELKTVEEGRHLPLTLFQKQ